MFYRKFADEGDHPVDNPNIYNVEGDNRLSPGLQPLKTGSALKISGFLFLLVWFHNCICYAEIILLSSTKQNNQVIRHLRVDSV